jgi:hypothetical protein
MALVATIAVVSLVAVLGVATLSLSSRLRQGGSLTLRSAHLDAAASFGLGAAVGEWSSRRLGALAVGATQRFTVEAPGMPIGVSVSVTRLDGEIFWTVSEAVAADGSMRRENLVLRRRMPRSDSVAMADSSDVEMLDGFQVDSLAATAPVSLPGGSVWTPTDGVVHATGDLIVHGGTATGILVVEGRLFVASPLTYSGVVVARGGIDVVGQETIITGALRVSGANPVSGFVTVGRSATAVESVLAKAFIPRPVAGRPWAEMY